MLPAVLEPRDRPKEAVLFRVACAWVAFALALVVRPGASRAAYTPAYGYRGPKLVLYVHAAERETVPIRWQALAFDGRPEGPEHLETHELHPGAQKILLEVGEGSGHRVRFTRGGRTFTIWANRG